MSNWYLQIFDNIPLFKTVLPSCVCTVCDQWLTFSYRHMWLFLVYIYAINPPLCGIWHSVISIPRILLFLFSSHYLIYKPDVSLLWARWLRKHAILHPIHLLLEKHHKHKQTLGLISLYVYVCCFRWVCPVPFTWYHHSILGHDLLLAMQKG